MAITKRPIASSDPNLERVFSHFDAQLEALDRRRTTKIILLSSSADLATVIRKVNEIIKNLEKSGFSE